MKLLLFLLIICISNTALSQSFTEEWSDFKLENWNLKAEINDSDETYLDKEIQGTLVFQKSNEKYKNITYYVYSLSDLNEGFKKRVQDWMFIQSCFTYTNDEVNFTTFSSNDFYYLLQPCHNCHTDRNNDCKNLALEISQRF